MSPLPPSRSPSLSPSLPPFLLLCPIRCFLSVVFTRHFLVSFPFLLSPSRPYWCCLLTCSASFPPSLPSSFPPSLAPFLFPSSLPGQPRHGGAPFHQPIFLPRTLQGRHTPPAACETKARGSAGRRA